MDKVDNLECLYQGYAILEEEWVTDPNLSILSQDNGRKPFFGCETRALTLLKLFEIRHITIPSHISATAIGLQNLI